VSGLALRAATRTFGDFVAVDALDLAVEPGEVVGLLGANGAGKTTAIRMLLGLLSPSSGNARHFGGPPTRASRSRIGYVPQGLGLWPDLSVDENLAFTAAAFGGDEAALEPEVAAVRDRTVASLPLGLRRRVAFTAALQHDPDALVLDEPTSGVDPLGRAALWDRIRDRADAGASVLVSTHFMDEAVQCDRLVVLVRGRAVAEGSERELVEGRRAIEVSGAPWPEVFDALAAAGAPATLRGRNVRVPDADPTWVEARLAAAGIEASLDVVPATLEERMVELAASGGGDPP